MKIISFTVVADNHNLPMMKEMSAVYELTAIGENQTELKMTSYAKNLSRLYDLFNERNIGQRSSSTSFWLKVLYRNRKDCE